VAPADFWLVGPVRGPRDQLRLHWLNPYETGYCAFSSPLGDPTEVALLRDGERSAAMEDRWPADIVQALRRLLEQQKGRVRIRLALDGGVEPLRASVHAWQQTAFEGLTLSGRPVTERISLERAAPRSRDGVPRASGRAVILNTWYSTLPREPAKVVTPAARGVDVKSGYDLVADFLHHAADLRSLSALAVIAHGACEADDGSVAPGTFLARTESRAGSRERSWSLPAHTPPPLVILLACSSEQLELVDYASGLLERGACCVLASAGRIDASRAAAFIGEYLSRWRAGASVSEALAALDGTFRQNLLDRLWLLGDGDLRFGEPVRPIDPGRYGELPTAELRLLLGDDATRAYATAALADRATLLSVLTAGNLSRAVETLNRSLDLQSFSDESGRRLHQQLDRAYPSCTRATRGWLANYLMALSERYDHQAMRRYRRDRDRDVGGSCGLPIIMRFTAVAASREGQPVRSARALARGFEILKDVGEDSPVDRLELMGTTANQLIDLNLPVWARSIVSKALDELDEVDFGEASFLEFKMLDRLARADLRAGYPEAALAAMVRKRQEALVQGQNGHRELAWLVYTAAWQPAAPTRLQREWLKESVRGVDELSQRVGADPGDRLVGNDDLTYLLRALAAWHCARPAPEIAERLVDWIDTATDQIECGQSDPGPWGFLTGFLAAAGIAPATQAWALARAHLLVSEYRLEAIGLEALQPLDRVDHVFLGEQLRQFQRTRAEIVTVLSSALCDPALLGPKTRLEDELKRRYGLEESSLSSLPAELAARRISMLHAGLIPM
jgi:hypothetical protein